MCTMRELAYTSLVVFYTFKSSISFEHKEGKNKFQLLLFLWAVFLSRLFRWSFEYVRMNNLWKQLIILGLAFAVCVSHRLTGLIQPSHVWVSMWKYTIHSRTCVGDGIIIRLIDLSPPLRSCVSSLDVLFGSLISTDLICTAPCHPTWCVAF